MDAFIVELPNRLVALAHVAEAIAARGINITGCCGATTGEAGSVVLLTDDDAGTRRALVELGYPVRQVELVAIWISDRPGGLAEAARRLDENGCQHQSADPDPVARRQRPGRLRD